jgi:hypothetical protein
MNALTETLHRPRRRLAELDPFEPDETAGPATEQEADASYGCVDWYAYGLGVGRAGQAYPLPVTDAKAPERTAPVPRPAIPGGSAHCH